MLAVRFSKRDMPAQTIAVVGAAGSFAAIATLFGSPLPRRLLLMEVVGPGGAMLDVVLLPGLLAAGVGALIFVGLDAWTGFGTFSLAVPNLPAYSHPDLAQFGWAPVIAPRPPSTTDTSAWSMSRTITLSWPRRSGRSGAALPVIRGSGPN